MRTDRQERSTEYSEAQVRRERRCCRHRGEHIHNKKRSSHAHRKKRGAHRQPREGPTLSQRSPVTQNFPGAVVQAPQSNAVGLAHSNAVLPFTPQQPAAAATTVNGQHLTAARTEAAAVTGEHCIRCEQGVNAQVDQYVEAFGERI